MESALHVHFLRWVCVANSWVLAVVERKHQIGHICFMQMNREIELKHSKKTNKKLHENTTPLELFFWPEELTLVKIDNIACDFICHHTLFSVKLKRKWPLGTSTI